MIKKFWAWLRTLPGKLRDATATEYRSVGVDVGDYFSAVGSWPVLLGSPFLHLAVVITLVCFGSWTGTQWSDLPLQVLPNLLGFGLAAFSLLFAFGDEKFRAFLATPHMKSDETHPAEPAITIQASSILLHFVLVQVAALLLAVFAHTHPLLAISQIGFLQGAELEHSAFLHLLKLAYSGFAFFMFVLSITLAGNAALNIFHMTGWYVEHVIGVSEAEEGENRAP